MNKSDKYFVVSDYEAYDRLEDIPSNEGYIIKGRLLEISNEAIIKKVSKVLTDVELDYLTGKLTSKPAKILDSTPIVESSIIERITLSNNGHLKVKLTSGNEYTYEDVSWNEYRSFKRADSKGRFYNEHIKGEKKRVDPS